MPPTITPTPAVELKNVKRAAFASEETDCFQATIYIGGKKAGSVSNDGHGGSNSYEPRDLYARLKAITDTLPPVDVSYMYKDDTQHTMDQCPDTFIGELLGDYLEYKDLQKLCKNKTLFRVPGKTYKPGEFMVMPRFYLPTVKEYIEKNYPGALILNEDIGAGKPLREIHAKFGK